MSTTDQSSHDMPSQTERIPDASQIVVSRATAGDLIGLRNLQRRCFRDGQAFGLATLLAFHLLPRAYVFVARHGEEIVGCVIGDVQKDQARVLNICVDPAYRRQGLGSALLSVIEKRLNHYNMTLMVEDKNFVAQALYRRYGYLPAGDLRDYYGRNRHGILMQKRRNQPALNYQPAFVITNGRGDEH